jgi:transcriptional regulator GlxA family with amidase domain
MDGTFQAIIQTGNLGGLDLQNKTKDMIHFTRLAAMIAMGFVLSGFSYCANAQDEKPKKVAIFLYPGVEVLDFAGPSEVFAASGFDTYTVSADGKDVLSQGFITVRPQYSLENAPVPDIVVFPGGGAGAPSKNPVLLEWVRKLHERGSILMSVCTGAQILAKAGLLDNKNVTTWHGFIPDLQTMLPNSVVLANTRYVDNGNIITTAGVSAGIDGALYLVSRLNGMEAAKKTAYYMEYVNWDPAAGRVDVVAEKAKNKP